MPSRRRFVLLAVLLVWLIGPAANAQLQTFPKAELTIVSAGGPHKFTVELATTRGQMAQGLMCRKSLATDADMLFVDQQGRIINIHERAVPGSLDPIAAAGPARAVIELNGGTAGHLGIKP